MNDEYPRDVAPIVRDLASWADALREAVLRANYRFDKRAAVSTIRGLSDELTAALDVVDPQP